MLGACFGALYWLLLPGHFPITSVELTGNLKNSSKAEIEAALPRASGNAPGNFFRRRSGRVARRRRAPALGAPRRRCGASGPTGSRSRSRSTSRSRAGPTIALVNTHGETLSRRRAKRPCLLFVAPGGTSSRGDTALPALFRDRGAARHQRGAHRAHAAPRLAAASRQRPAPRARPRCRHRGGAPAPFRRVYPRRCERRKHEYVDLRYPNGFALRVPDWNG